MEDAVVKEDPRRLFNLLKMSDIRAVRFVLELLDADNQRFSKTEYIK